MKKDSAVLTSVVIPEGVTIIGKEAFKSCYRLETVVLPRSLHTIRDNAFGFRENKKERIDCRT